MSKIIKPVSAKVAVQKSHYAIGGATAIFLVCMDPDEAGEPYCTLSVNLDTPPSEGCFYLKDWSENEEIAQWFLREGLIEMTGAFKLTGHVEAHEVRITPKLEALFMTDEEIQKELENL